MTISPRDFTIGVEEEYQLVDARTGDLRIRARWVIAGDWTGEVKPEMLEHTVEVEIRVCEGAEYLRRLALWAADETVLELGMDRRTEQRLEETTVP